MTENQYRHQNQDDEARRSPFGLPDYGMPKFETAENSTWRTWKCRRHFAR